MRIVHITTAPNRGNIVELVSRFPILERFPAAQAAAGAEVAVLCRSDRDSLRVGGGLHLESVAGTRLEACLRLRDRAALLAPEVFHLHGITANSAMIAGILRSRFPRTVIAIQDQAFHWPRSIAGRLVVRAGLPAADCLFFASQEQAGPLLEGRVATESQVVELPGGSSEFEPIPRAEARRRTGLEGRPLYLWVGRLAPVKDPLLASRGLRRVLQANPSARLAMAYGTAELLDGVKANLAPVAAQVKLLGQVPRQAMPDVFGSADRFVSTSVREGYSYALVEAMSCGLSPVVSAIPSSLKAIGQLGHAFHPGDEEALVAALQRPPSTRAAVRRGFERRLSYSAMAMLSLEAYALAAAHRSGREPPHSPGPVGTI